MAKMLYECGSASAQDPMFRIRRSLIVPELNIQNWNRHAIIRVRDGLRKYLYIERRQHTKEHGGDWVYLIEVHNLDSQDRDWSNPVFSSLEEALAQANAWGEVAAGEVPSRSPGVHIVSVLRSNRTPGTASSRNRNIPHTAFGWTVEEVLRDMRSYPTCRRLSFHAITALGASPGVVERATRT